MARDSHASASGSRGTEAVRRRIGWLAHQVDLRVKIERLLARHIHRDQRIEIEDVQKLKSTYKSYSITWPA